MVDNTSTPNIPSSNGITVSMRGSTMKKSTPETWIRTQKCQAQVMTTTGPMRNVVQDHPHPAFGFCEEIIKLNFVHVSPTPIPPCNGLMRSS